VVDGIAALGTLLIVGLMAIICADIVARNVLGGSLPLVSELGALLVVMIVALQLAATVRADRLARTLAFLAPLEDRRRAAALLRAVL
jgi:TRAP-type C4-dicarboxylate transport system permease small subunit